jgi:uncharacterized protein (DUF58 family)
MNYKEGRTPGQRALGKDGDPVGQREQRALGKDGGSVGQRGQRGGGKEGRTPVQREEEAVLSLTLVQFCLLALVAVAVKAGQTAIGIVLLAAVLVAGACRLWAALTARNLKVRLEASRIRMFPGDETVISYKVTNQKFLPVLWVDVLQPLPLPACMMPEEDREQVKKMNDGERTAFGVAEGETCLLFQQRLSLVGSYQTAAYETRWKAVQRGIYSLENTRIYTGDGLGLTRYRLAPSEGSRKHFVIYPKIIPVNVERFLKNLWEGEWGSKGVMEDPSVIRLTRPYENSDSMKRMNWRLLARGQGLTVNQYEVISPRAMHFIFDGESFRRMASGGTAGGAEQGTDRLEEVLSILASMVLRLTEQGLDCGFSFPEGDGLKAVNLFAAAGDVTGEILYRMAAYQFRRPVSVRNEETGREEKVWRPSLFDEDGLLGERGQVGIYYYVTADKGSAAASSLLPKLEAAPVDTEVLTYDMLQRLKEGEKS